MASELPLQGLRVLDLGRLLPAPYATLVLSDRGASVDKLEEPGAGDYLRAVPPLVGETSAEFAALNRDKRGLVLDLKHPRGPEVLRRLLPRYDVLVESFRPGVLDRLGLAHETLLATSPRLVVCSITGYGRDGPHARKAGHDIDYLARAGVLGLTGPADAPPVPFGGQVADIGAALYAVIGILAALEERHRTGRGSHVEVSMAEAAASFSIAAFARVLAGTPTVRGEEALTGGLATYGIYETKDGALFALGALEPKFWNEFCEVTGLGFDLSALVPGPHQAALRARVAEIVRGRTRQEWEDALRSRDACFEPVRTPEEAAADGSVPVDGAALRRLPRTPGAAERAHRGPPRPGEHTIEILREAGIEEDEIRELLRARVVYSSPRSSAR